MWDDPTDTHLFTDANARAADILINLMADYDMDLALPLGTPTHQHFVSKRLLQLDHVICSGNFLPNLLMCNAFPENQPPKTDHFPIVTIFDLTITRNVEEPKYNFRGTDWPEFHSGLKARVQKVTLRDPQNIEDFEAMLDEVTNAILSNMKEFVPISRPSPYAKRWWSKELAQERTALRTLAKKAAHKRKTNPSHPVHEEFRRARNDYGQHLRDARRDHWEDWVEATDAMSLWTVNKFVMAAPFDGGSSRIPTLKVKQADDTIREVRDNEAKSKALHDSFFYPPPQDSGINPDFEYPPPKTEFHHVTDDQIHRAIGKLKLYKAPGPNQISNSVYTHCADILVPFLGRLFRATFHLKHYPECWKLYSTVVIRKPGKPDYSIAKAYQPIALLDTMAKILSSCIVEDFVFMAEKYSMLPANHFGCRPGRTATNLLHYLVKWVRDSLRKKLVVSVLFHDITGAFPNTVIPVLIHDMRCNGVPKEYTDWIQRRMDGRKTILAFDDYKSDPFQIFNGLDQ
jgi:hypothetical protein